MGEDRARRDRPFADLLPEIYREDPVLDKLLAVFERCYLDLEQRIEGMPEQLYDVRRTPEAFLDFVGALVGLRNDRGQFTPAQMRDLIPCACWIHRWKGTAAALRFILQRYLRVLCGHPVAVHILEPGEGAPETLPGERPLIVVRVGWARALEDASERRRLEMLVRDYTPAPVNFRIDYQRVGPLGGIYLGHDSWI